MALDWSQNAHTGALGGWADREGVRTSASEQKSSSPSSSKANASSSGDSDGREKESAHWMCCDRDRVCCGFKSLDDMSTCTNSCLRVSAMCAWPRKTRRLWSLREAPSELFRRAIRMMRVASSTGSLGSLPARFDRLGLVDCIDIDIFEQMGQGFNWI